VALAALLGIAQGKTDYSAWMTGAKIDYSSGRFAKAAMKFRNAVNERPGSADARHWLGMSLSQIGKESLAVAASQLDTCFTLDSTYVGKIAGDNDKQYLATNALGATANAKMIEGDYAAAVRYVSWAMSINPGNPVYYMTLGNAYIQLDMADSILAVAQRLLKNDPEAAQASYFIAIYFSKKEQMDSSLVYFKQAGERYEKGDAKQREKLATILKAKNPADVEPIADKLVALRNNSAELKKYIEEDLKQGKNLQPVAVIANDLFIDRMQIGSSYFKAGVAAIQNADLATDTLVQQRYFTLSDTLFAHAAAADPENFDALWYLGYANYRLNRDSACIAGFTRAIRLSEARRDLVADKDKELWYYLGTSEAKLKKYDDAIVHLRRAITADPTNLVAYDNLAFVYKDMAKGAKEQVYTDSALSVLEEKEQNGIRFSVWSRTDTTALGRFTDLKGDRFVIVELTVANKNAKADSVIVTKLFITGEDKKDYPVNIEATAVEELEGRGLMTSGLEPSQKLDGVVVFSLPRTVKALGLLYKARPGLDVRVPFK
jgi:tetratricopeptide (TPR) repeat protein